ncbi:MAG: phage holin, partial [Clostridia bacterium]|nr:phage holin [Clostridia bacterium]
MKWKNRFTNYNFWISIVSAVLLIFQAFNIEFDLDCISEIVTAVLGLLVVIGIISDPTKVAVSEDKIKSLTEQKAEDKSEKMEEEKPAKEIETEVKETVKETVEEANKKEEDSSIPSAEKDEDCSNLYQDDFKVVVDKISKDLEENIKILENINKDVAPEHSMEEAEMLEVEKESEDIIDGQIKIEEVEAPQEIKVEDVEPVEAETIKEIVV